MLYKLKSSFWLFIVPPSLVGFCTKTVCVVVCINAANTVLIKYLPLVEPEWEAEEIEWKRSQRVKVPFSNVQSELRPLPCTVTVLLDINI